MIKPQKRSLRQSIVGGLCAVLSAVAPGCFTGGSVEPVIGFGNRAIESVNGIDYNSATSFGVRGRAKTKSKVEVEAEASFYSTSGEFSTANEDVSAIEISVNALYPVWSNPNADVYAGAGLTSTSQDTTFSFDGFPGSTTDSYSETDARAFVGGRLKAGKGNIDARVSAGSRGTSASLGYEFTF
jgi:hypothetical protein